jgi:hypothetical protein
VWVIWGLVSSSQQAVFGGGGGLSFFFLRFGLVLAGEG